MFPQILALVIKGGPDGGTVDIGSGPFIVGAMPFIFLIVLVSLVIWAKVTKKRLEHLQIMAAIEKGTPFSELRPIITTKGAGWKWNDWIRSLTTGIAFLLIGLGMAIISLVSVLSAYPDKDAGFGLSIISVVLIAIGIAGVIRGILQRKADKALSADKSAFDANHGQ